MRRRALLVGTGEHLSHLHEMLGRSRRGIDYEFVGVLAPDLDGIELPLLGDLKALPRVLATHRVDEVILADSDFGERELLETVEQAHRRGVKVRIAPKTTELLVQRADYVPGQSVPLFEVRSPVFAGGEWVLKRTFDLAVSVVVLIAGLPLWLLTAAAVTLTSPGPVLYRDRVCVDVRCLSGHRHRLRKAADLHDEIDLPRPLIEDERSPNPGKARELFKASLAKKAPNTAPFGPNYGMAYLYVYEGNFKEAIKTLEAYGNEYIKTGQEKVFPSVFIWNSIARLHLEYGDANEAIKYYEKGYATVPNSTIDDLQKKTWLGRLHHGKGRALAEILGGMKMVADGSISERTAWLSQPYVGRPDDFGIQVMTEQELYENGRKAHEADWQIGVHANGDRAIDMVLRVYERLQREHPQRDPRFRLEHCTIVNDSLIRRIKALGAIPTPFAAYVYYHGEKMREYGAERLDHMFALRSFLDAGIRVAPGSDYPPGPFEPMMALQSSVTRTESSSGLTQASRR